MFKSKFFCLSFSWEQNSISKNPHISKWVVNWLLEGLQRGWLRTSFAPEVKEAGGWASSEGHWKGKRTRVFISLTPNEWEGHEGELAFCPLGSQGLVSDAWHLIYRPGTCSLWAEQGERPSLGAGGPAGSAGQRYVISMDRMDMWEGQAWQSFKRDLTPEAQDFQQELRVGGQQGL